MQTETNVSVWASVLATLSGSPEPPLKWTYSYLEQIQARLQRRAGLLTQRIDALALGRTIPEVEQITIGSGRQLHLAVLFLDICGFSERPSSNFAEQSAVLSTLNIFMAEMLTIIRDFGGTFEKNTGDGLMAYLGAQEADLQDSSRRAVEMATVMHYVNDHVLTPWFIKKGQRPVKFRVGIDAGQVTVGRVGIPGLADQLVAIGSHANIACKIMRFLPDGGIVIGNNVWRYLTDNWRKTAVGLGGSGFSYTHNNAPYFAWGLDHRLTHPGLL